MEILKETIRSLSHNKMRTLLSMLGIIIGVTAVITVISLGQGMSASVNKTLNSLGGKTIIIQPGSSRSGGGGNIFNLSNIFSMSDVENIRNMAPNVGQITPIIQNNATFKYDKNLSNATTLAAQPSIFSILELKVSSGRVLDEDDERNQSKVCVIGQDTAAALFTDGTDPLGQTIILSTTGRTQKLVPLKIVGIFERTGSKLFFNPDRAVFVPFNTSKTRIVASTGKFASMLVSAVDDDSAKEATLEINHILYMKFNDNTKYMITAQESILQVVNQINGVIQLVLVAIAGVSLLVGGIGIMNIMLVSVSERTKEIGIKKAIGAPRKRIMLEFLAESVFITFFAGGIGILMGILLSKLIEVFAKQYQMQAVISIPAIIVAFSVSVGVGLFFGLYPASKASKLSPIEALRNE